MATKITLKDLKVADLKKELEERDLECAGRKSILQERLRQFLIDSGEDPDTYLFETTESILEEKFQKFEEQSVMLKEQLEEKFQKFEEQSVMLKEQIDEKLQKSEERFDEKFQKFEEHSKTLENKLEVMLKEQIDEKLQKSEERFEEKFQKVEEQLKGLLEAEIKEIKERFANPPLQPTNKETTEIVKCEEVESHQRIRVKPPQFDGKVSWTNYVRQFEAAAEANGWSTAEKATQLVVALRGEALDVLNTITAEEQRDYQQLVQRLEMRYGHAHLEKVHHSQLKNRHQKPNESLQEFETDISRLTHLAYPSVPQTIMETLAIQAFIDGVRDSETKQALLFACPNTLKEALAHALKFESAKYAAKGYARVRALEDTTEKQPQETNEAALRRIIKELSERKQLRCWNCGKLGHIRSRCKQNERPEPNKEPSEN